jgi:hypothetical protein
MSRQIDEVTPVQRDLISGLVRFDCCLGCL